MDELRKLMATKLRCIGYYYPRIYFSENRYKNKNMNIIQNIIVGITYLYKRQVYVRSNNFL